MIVVADTSVILNLCCVGQQDLLRGLFRDVIIPPEVRLEFEAAARRYPRFAGLNIPAWVQEQTPHSIPNSLRQVPDLDPGETSAIALALELAADALLIDEATGRRVARLHGLIPIGVLGVLVHARRAGLLAAVAPIIEQLERRANFWVADELRREILSEVGEAH